MQVVRKSKVGVSDGALKFGVASMGLACLINPDRSVDKVEVILPPNPQHPHRGVYEGELWTDEGDEGGHEEDTAPAQHALAGKGQGG